MGSAIAEGENRAVKAIEEALNSPLLNNNDITGAKNILLNITSGLDEISMDEIGDITDYVNATIDKNALIIWGTGVDEKLEKKICVTIIATGFEAASIPELYARKKTTDRVKLEDYPENRPVISNGFEVRDKKRGEHKDIIPSQRVIEFDIRNEKLLDKLEKKKISTDTAAQKLNEQKKPVILREQHTPTHRFKPLTSHNNLLDEKESIEKLENEPAYLRKKVKIDPVKYSNDSKISRYSLEDNEDDHVTLRSDNSYLHDNVD